MCIKAHRVTCLSAAAEWCLNQGAEGTHTVAVPAAMQGSMH